MVKIGGVCTAAPAALEPRIGRGAVSLRVSANGGDEEGAYPDQSEQLSPELQQNRGLYLEALKGWAASWEGSPSYGQSPSQKAEEDVLQPVLCQLRHIMAMSSSAEQLYDVAVKDMSLASRLSLAGNLLGAVFLSSRARAACTDTGISTAPAWLGSSPDPLVSVYYLIGFGRSQCRDDKLNDRLLQAAAEGAPPLSALLMWDAMDRPAGESAVARQLKALMESNPSAARSPNGFDNSAFESVLSPWRDGAGDSLRTSMATVLS